MHLNLYRIEYGPVISRNIVASSLGEALVEAERLYNDPPHVYRTKPFADAVTAAVQLQVDIDSVVGL